MLHATLKSLWARKVRLILSALSIVLGVAFVAGSLMFTNLLRASFDQIVSGALGDVNVSAGSGGVAGFENVNPAEQPRLTPGRWTPSEGSTASCGPSVSSPARRCSRSTGTAACSHSRAPPASG
ncbi:ABC transporter permease [Tessaracoccus sp. HDW20]|uniref:ABC transporter permease n=1 Tax=Tessaracoccus coleopterorum TaxID=2714950 RepID=UPI0018D47E62|nr:ABC transporter permease [Tessaracoccus coleopterorum]NHB84933.1 ABC transporter permease [Tessaracoccus coleopterorum]